MTRSEGEEKTFSTVGEWKAATDNKETALLCLMEISLHAGGSAAEMTPYFGLSFLDDGTIMATPSISSSTSAGATSAFGFAAEFMITLLIFEKA